MSTTTINKQMQELERQWEGMRAGRAGWDRSEYGDGGFESGTFGSQLTGERWETWHGLGKFYADKPHLTIAEVCEDVPELASPIIKVESPTILLPDGTRLDFPDHCAVYRELDRKPLGLGMSAGYPVVPPAEHFAFMDALIDADAATIVSAMTLRRGRAIAVTYELPGSIQIAGWTDETIRKFLCLTDSYDGGGALKVAASPIRQECTNSNRLAMTKSPRVWSVRHTKNMRVRVQEARDTLKLAHTYFLEFEQAANNLVSTKMTGREFGRFLDRLVPLTVAMKEDPGGRSATNRERALEAIRGCYKSSPNLQNVQGTRWAAYQAVTEWNQWARPVRSTPGKTEQEQRWERVWSGNQAIEDRAAKLLVG